MERNLILSIKAVKRAWHTYLLNFRPGILYGRKSYYTIPASCDWHEEVLVRVLRVDRLPSKRRGTDCLRFVEPLTKSVDALHCRIA